MSEETSVQARIDRACFRLMTLPEFDIFRLWWESETMRAALPPGAPDTGRLLMGQGDKERLLQVMSRASRHQTRAIKNEEVTDAAISMDDGNAPAAQRGGRGRGRERGAGTGDRGADD